MRESVRVSWSGVQTTGDCSVLLIRFSRKLLHMPAVADHDRLAGQGGGREGRQVYCQLRYVFQGGELAVHGVRSEEHTSELQSRPHLVCRLLLEKKKKKNKRNKKRKKNINVKQT